MRIFDWKGVCFQLIKMQFLKYKELIRHNFDTFGVLIKNLFLCSGRGCRHCMGDAIAQRIRLPLPFCSPGFESQAYHLSFYKIMVVSCRKDENNRKEGGIGPFNLLQNLNGHIHFKILYPNLNNFTQYNSVHRIYQIMQLAYTKFLCDACYDPCDTASGFSILCHFGKLIGLIHFL